MINKCPICESEAKSKYSCLESAYYIQCTKCKFDTPFYFKQEDALKIWNNLELNKDAQNNS